jgi:CRISPR type I-E-associated protein CasB/Cse2
MPSGDHAELRRLDAGGAAAPAFWRLLAEVHPALLERSVAEPGRVTERLDDETSCWQCALSSMARLRGQHAEGVSAGTALARAGFSELRLARLLRSRAPATFDEVRAAVAILASRAVDLDVVELVKLVLLPESSDAAESLRRRIAATYYATTAKES